jgi:hypothetical protein
VGVGCEVTKQLIELNYWRGQRNGAVWKEKHDLCSRRSHGSPSTEELVQAAFRAGENPHRRQQGTLPAPQKKGFQSRLQSTGGGSIGIVQSGRLFLEFKAPDTNLRGRFGPLNFFLRVAVYTKYMVSLGVRRVVLRAEVWIYVLPDDFTCRCHFEEPSEEAFID